MVDFQPGEIETASVILRYSEGGSGPPVVFLHGTLTGLEDGLVSLAPHLADRFRFVAFDRPGNGGSGKAPGSASIWRQAALLREAARALGLQRPILVGHSQGGAVAMAWALSWPDEVAGVVAVSPYVLPEPRLEQAVFGPRAIFGLGDALSYALMPADALLLPALWRGMFAPQSPPRAFADVFPIDEAGERRRLRAAGEESLMLNIDLSAALPRYSTCRLPVRIVLGRRDLVANPWHGRNLSMLAPLGRLRELADLGHMLHHFAPDAVIEEIEAIAGSGRRDLGQARGWAAA